MGGYVDIHSHWVTGIDDGAPTADEAERILRGLRSLGFDEVIGTPHMMADRYDNTKAQLLDAYQRTKAQFVEAASLPELGIACEHHLDDLVFGRLLAGEGLLYPAGRSVLLEFPTERFPLNALDRLFELRCRRIVPVLAHPERYRPAWKKIESLEPILDGGTVLLLDLPALAGTHGRKVRRCAERLLEAGFYYAACSDAHRSNDLEAVERGVDRLFELMGKQEASFMLRDGPRAILTGKVDD